MVVNKHEILKNKEIIIDGVSYKLVKKRDTCKDCSYFDMIDEHAPTDKKHPNIAVWSHLCTIKCIQKYTCDAACKTHFKRKDNTYDG